MIRKQALLRREYLQRKSLSDFQRNRLERKARIKEALENGTPVSEQDLREEALENEYGVQTMHQMYDESTTKKKETADELAEMDDEYGEAGKNPPKILLTTGRDCSDKLKRFIKELKFIFPISSKINRGGHSTETVVESAKKNGFTDIIIVHETKGEPSGMTISHLPHGPTARFTIFNTITTYEAYQSKEGKEKKAPISEQFPHLVFHNFKTALGKRVETVLKFLFPVPKKDSSRVITFYNDNDFISFRQHTYKKEQGTKIVLTELGPRFEMRLFKITMGTIDNKNAEDEWILHSFTNNAYKQNTIGLSKDDLKGMEEEEKHRIQEMETE